MTRWSRCLLPVVCTLTLLAGCSGPNPYQAAANAPTATAADVGTVGDNEFVPDKNLSDCVGTLERPNCGSTAKGGRGTYLTFLALILGLAFIFWRIARGVKARDRIANRPTTDPTGNPAGNPADPSA
jgi:hypothetical protein